MFFSKSQNLGFVYHEPFWEENGEIWTSHPPIGRYVEALAGNFQTVTLIAPVKTLDQEPLYLIKASNLDIIPLKPIKNVQNYYLHLFHFYKNCFRAIKKVDILHIRIPTLTGFPAFLAARVYKKPIFLVVVGKNLETIKRANYSGIKKLSAHLIGWLQDYLMKHMIIRCLTFTNGEDLLNEYHNLNPEIQMLRSSTINQTDILLSDRDTCQTAPYNVLTVAVVTPHKGTSLIPEVIARLRNMGIVVKWKYVGKIEGNSGALELEKTLQLAHQFEVEQNLSFEPPMGFDRLLPLYRENDIFVLPTYIEGIPRVILEAQASGLPVITTRVGGIPGAVKDGIDAILIPPGNPVEIASAIKRVITDNRLRKDLIRNGILAAQTHTLETETQRMIEYVSKKI